MNVRPVQADDLRAPQPGESPDGRIGQELRHRDRQQPSDFGRREDGHVAVAHLDPFNTVNRILDRVTPGHGETEQRA